MTSKTIMIGLVALAFVAGSIMTGTMASAEKGGVGDNLIVDALNNIATAISGIDPNVTVDTPITVEVPAESIQVDVVGLQGPVGDKGPTGDKGETGDKGPTGDDGNSGITTINTRTQATTGSVTVAGEILTTQIFTLDEPTTVFISAFEMTLKERAAGGSFINLVIDGNTVARGSATAPGTVHVSWTGVLSEGTHTIRTQDTVGDSLWRGPESVTYDFGAINTMLIP